MNEDVRQAGAAILQDLELWNRSAIFLKQEIEAVAIKHCEEALVAWCKRHDWIKDGHALGNLEENWFCPRAWQRKNDYWYGYFHFCRSPGHSSNSYALADLVGVGQAKFGFYFSPGYAVFGGRKAWLAYVGSYPMVIDRIAERGWHSLGEGEFFLAGELTLEMLQKAWDTGNWACLTGPLLDKMDKLLEDSPLFDELFAGALSKAE